jgi:hypothetical protein
MTQGIVFTGREAPMHVFEGNAPNGSRLRSGTGVGHPSAIERAS